MSKDRAGQDRRLILNKIRIVMDVRLLSIIHLRC